MRWGNLQSALCEPEITMAITEWEETVVGKEKQPTPAEKQGFRFPVSSCNLACEDLVDLLEFLR